MKSPITFLVSAASMVCLLSTFGQQAHAGTIHNGWNYAVDSFKDGTDYSKTGSKSRFEFYGMAFTEKADRLYFAFKSNLPFTPGSLNQSGVADSAATGGRISYGDLFLDFNNTTSFGNDGSLYAIRFDASNDTSSNGIVNLGLYRNVTAESRTKTNGGYESLQAHTNAVKAVNASYGDLDDNTTYFGNNAKTSAYTTIKAGEYISELTFHTRDKLSLLGLDFNALGIIGNDNNRQAQIKTQTFGFSIARSALPKDGGNFIATLFAECGNDGVVLSGNVKDVPEPSAMIGLMTAGVAFGGSRLRRRQA